MACHLGVYYVDLQFNKIALPTEPPTFRIDCELALKEERQLVGKRISQVQQIGNVIIAALWDKPYFYKITRSNYAIEP